MNGPARNITPPANVNRWRHKKNIKQAASNLQCLYSF